jgi:hypothetical protein
VKLPETLPSKRFRAEFQVRLGRRRFVDAKEAWDRLQQLGCDPSVLLASLEAYCLHVAAKNESRPDESYVQEFLEMNASVVAEAKQLAKDLEKDASRIEQLNRKPEIFRESSWWEELKPTLPDDLRSQASWLRGVAEKISRED